MNYFDNVDTKLYDLMLSVRLADAIIISFYQLHVMWDIFVVGSLKIDSGEETLTFRTGSDLLVEY